MFLKKVFHKCQEEMQEKMKVALQKDLSLVQVQQQQYTILYSFYFCIFFISLILMVLTMTKYHENLLRDSSMSSHSVLSFFPPWMNLKNQMKRF